jgi:hypothetical protein
MDNVQNCDSYINIPSSQTYRSYFRNVLLFCVSSVKSVYGDVECHLGVHWLSPVWLESRYLSVSHNKIKIFPTVS